MSETDIPKRNLTMVIESIASKEFVKKYVNQKITEIGGIELEAMTESEVADLIQTIFNP